MDIFGTEFAVVLGCFVTQVGLDIDEAMLQCFCQLLSLLDGEGGDVLAALLTQEL